MISHESPFHRLGTNHARQIGDPRLRREQGFGSYSRFVQSCKEHRTYVLSAIGITAGLVVLMTTIWFFFLRTHAESETIMSFSWHRQEEVQDYQPRAKSGWDYPSDAYAVTSEWRYHYSYTVSDPPTCFTSTDTKGNTSETCYPNSHQVAVYDWYYSYTVDRWEFQMWLTKDGFDQVPLWPPHENEHFDGTPVYGHRRLSGVRQDSYTVHYANDKGKGRHTSTRDDEGLTQARWAKLKIGDGITINLNRQDSIRSINWPKGV